MVRIQPAMSPVDTMTTQEIDQFLKDSKSPLKLGTVDTFGDAIIHPLWYHYENGKFYLITAVDSKKLANIKRTTKIYFCVDTEARPYKGVKGKGTIGKINDQENAIKIAEKLITRYLGNIDNPLGKSLLSRLREGKETVLQVTPLYYTVWDDSKSP